MIDHFQRVRDPDHRDHRQSGVDAGRGGGGRWSCRTGARLVPEAVAPTTSTTMTLALGDALAMTVMREKGFTRTDFGRLHPAVRWARG